MNFQVLPLRVLVSRQVIRDRMDYTGYLAGKTKSEMDILDRLAGRYVVQDSELTIERFLGGEELSADEWETKRRQMCTDLTNFLNGTAELSIVETSSSGPRKWYVSDVDGLRKVFPLTSRSGMRGAKHWTQADDFIEDGKLMTAKKTFELVDGKLVLVTIYRDSFSTDKQGNVTRKFIWSSPTSDFKITKVMMGLRVV